MKYVTGPWGKLLFWASLTLAVAAMVLGFRYRPPPDVMCLVSVDLLTPVEMRGPVRLPIRVVPAVDAPSPGILHFRFNIGHLAGDRGPQALSIGEGLPFYRLIVNGANLTPATDLASGNLRDMAPHLHVLPVDVLRAGLNVAELELPISVDLAEVRVDQICAGSLAALAPAHRANWWRMVGVPAVCALLFCVLGVLGVALWLLSARHPAYVWYVCCVVLMLARSLYVSTSFRPISPLFCVFLGNIAIAMLPYALYRFMRAYWQFSLLWLSRILRVMTIAALLCCIQLYLVPRFEFAQINYVIFLLITTIGGTFVVAAMAGRLHSLRRLERTVVIWVGLVGFAGSLLEIASLFEPFAQRWMWTKPPAMAVLAIGLGYLLLRRMALGADLLAHASDTLAIDIDHAIAANDTPLWANVSASIARRERGRMIRDIHDGFGSRLVAVLARARRELPHSLLHRQIQRALLDMRLMLDAMDEASRSLATAMARLRHRVDPMLGTAGIAAEWRVDAIADVWIDDRRKLICVFRCLEELLSNSAQHSRADRLVVDIAIAGGALDFQIQDNGCGSARACVVEGGGITRARLRAQTIGGSLRLAAEFSGPGLHYILRVPLF